MQVGEIHVLLVEDDFASANLAAEYLEEAGVEVEMETDPERALSYLEDSTVDCVVSDYDMPGLTGLELLERVRERHADLPFVLFTGAGSESIASDAIASGVDEYVEKSVGTEQFDLLVKRIESAVEQHRTEAKLARTEERYQRLLETAPTPIAIIDREAVRFVNDACVSFLGARDAETVVGTDPLEFFDVAESQVARERMAAVLERQEPLDPVEYRLRTLDGEVRHTVMRSAPVTFEGEPAAQVVANDVTEYREAQAELEREKRTLETALDAVDDFFFILDEEGRPVRWNDRVPEVTGYDDDDLASLSMSEFFADDQAEVVRSAIDRMLGDGSATVEADVETADGDRIPFEFRGVRMTDEVGCVVGGCAIGRNVSGQRAYERELERYRALMETMGDAVYVVDESGKLLDVNQALVEQSGYERSELLGAPVTQFMDGSDIQAVTELVWEILTDPDRSSGTIEFETVDADGRTRVVEDNVSVLTDDEGAYVSTVGVLRDVTEERSQQRELRRQNERLNRFASLVSHDLRNPISVVQGFVDIAEASDDPEAYDRIRSAADRMESLVDDMLVLARHGQVVSDREPVELEQAARDAWRRVKTDDARLIVEETRTLDADPERLSALFENLFRNAVEHGSTSSRPAVDGGSEDASNDENGTLTVRVEPTDDGFAVADDGVGLPSDRQELFEYGVTHEEGTGLGLAIVEEICEAHGWRVAATDSASGGARFEVRL